MIVTREILIKALQNSLGKKGMGEEDIVKLVDYVLSFFGFDVEIIDNKLTSKDRDVFYMLEEEGILGTREEETQLKKGKPWRIHYWILKGDNIEKLARGTKTDDAQKKDYAVYDRISEDVWSRS